MQSFRSEVRLLHPAILSGAEIPTCRGIHPFSDADELIKNYSELVGSTVIAVDPNYYRPTEVDLLIGDSSKAKEKLSWEAETKLEKLVEIMVESDFKKVLEKGY